MNDRVYVVTGAGGAVGGALLERLLSHGAKVVALDRHAITPQEAVKDRCLALSLDLTDEQAVEAAFDRAMTDFGRIDGLANVAGGWRGGHPIEKTDLATFDLLIGMNLKSAFVCARSAMRRFSPGGRIANVATLPVLRGQGHAGSAAYGISKAGVVVLTQALAEEGRDRDIRANAIAPTTIRTPANEGAMPNADVSQWATLDEVVDTLVFLLRPECPTNGAIIPIPGRM